MGSRARSAKIASNVRIVLPPVAETVVEEGLVMLTRALTEAGIVEAEGYGMGGEFGYGANFENDVFLMHRYCWCERADECDWCMHGDQSDFMPRLNRRFGTTIEVYRQLGKETHYYDPPNFWFKALDLRVCWYKRIGRDTAMNFEPSFAQWHDVLVACLRSIGVDATQ